MLQTLAFSSNNNSRWSTRNGSFIFKYKFKRDGKYDNVDLCYLAVTLDSDPDENVPDLLKECTNQEEHHTPEKHIQLQEKIGEVSRIGKTNNEYLYL